ncbi:hypothetical protein AgCh_012606 [Apium graveolens]
MPKVVEQSEKILFYEHKSHPMTEVPPHSTYAATKGEAQVGATEPQPQGTIPSATQGTNSQLQQLHTPVNSQPAGYEYSTIVTTNPPYGMPLYPEEFSGPYTERDFESSDDEVAPRRRRAGKELMADGNQRPRSTRGVNSQEVQERIKAHEAEIQRLKRDLEAHQVPRPQLPPRGRNPPPIIDLDGPSQRRVVIPRADLSNLLPLRDPDDPTPPFTEEIMNSHMLGHTHCRMGLNTVFTTIKLN